MVELGRQLFEWFLNKTGTPLVAWLSGSAVMFGTIAVIGHRLTLARLNGKIRELNATIAAKEGTIGQLRQNVTALRARVEDNNDILRRLEQREQVLGQDGLTLDQVEEIVLQEINANN